MNTSTERIVHIVNLYGQAWQNAERLRHGHGVTMGPNDAIHLARHAGELAAAEGRVMALAEVLTVLEVDASVLERAKTGEWVSSLV